jgi:hypothetical protein
MNVSVIRTAHFGPNCSCCGKVLKEHSFEESVKCADAQHAESGGRPCESCGKLIGVHSDQELRACWDKRQK